MACPTGSSACVVVQPICQSTAASETVSGGVVVMAGTMQEAETLTMTRKERIRLDILTRLELGEFPAGRPPLCSRSPFASSSASAPASVLTVPRASSAPAVPPDAELRASRRPRPVVSPARARYADFTVPHFRDMLPTQEAILRSTPTDRRSLLDTGHLLPASSHLVARALRLTVSARSRGYQRSCA